MIEQNTDFKNRIERQTTVPTVLSAAEIIELCRYMPNLLATSVNPLPEDHWKSDLTLFMASFTREPEITAITEPIINAYAKLCEVTYPVTGASIIASRNARHHHLMITVGVFLGICLFGQLSVHFVANSSIENLNEWVWKVSYYFGLHVYPVMAGLLWGGLGSCVYLLKRVNDLAQSRQFDPDLYKGVWVRMVLGGTLGWVVVNIFDLESADLGGISIPAVAFITGLSVKIVYGALEKLVVTLEEKLNIGNLRSSEQRPNTLKNTLEQSLLFIDETKEIELSARIRELLKLLNNIKTT